MKVMLTGGGGFFGSRIKAAFLRYGFDVYSPDLPELQLLDYESVLEHLSGYKPDIIVHSAAFYGGLGICMSEPLRLFYDNITFTANIFRALAEVPVKKTVVIGSACAYPADEHDDLMEQNFWSGVLHDSVESYGFSKKVNLVGQRSLERQNGTPYLHPVITNLYGPGDVFTEYRSHVVAALIKKFADAKLNGKETVELWGTGKPVREFIHVDDAADAVAFLIENEVTGVINVGTGVDTSIKELSEIIKKYVGFQGRIFWNTEKPDGIMRKVLNVTRLKEETGWKPKYDLRSGLEDTIKWYMENKETADLRE